jgi:hypothetical protein
LNEKGSTLVPVGIVRKRADGLSPQARMMFIVILCRADATGVCVVPEGTLARDYGANRRTVQRLVAELAGKHLLSVRRLSEHPVRYQLRLDPDAGLAPPLPPPPIPLPGGKGWRKKLRRSAGWSRWRRAVLARDGYACGRCGASGPVLQVHHVMPMLLHPELRFEVWNGQTLCDSCHRLVHRERRAAGLPV